jgi:pseudaminic acid biosynthesis-associated methylase
LTEQEQLWAGRFGDEYVSRNTTTELIENNIDFFADALGKVRGVHTILELGCNAGCNLAALEYLDPSRELTGVDINQSALRQLRILFEDKKLEQPRVHCHSIVDFYPAETYDLVFTKGVLIHIDPNQLSMVYNKLFELSNRYILIAEYYNPKPDEVLYRGMKGKLFRRDFAGEMMDRYPLKLVDYGFRYHRGEYPLDDITFFLMEKK